MADIVGFGRGPFPAEMLGHSFSRSDFGSTYTTAPAAAG